MGIWKGQSFTCEQNRLIQFDKEFKEDNSSPSSGSTVEERKEYVFICNM